MMALKGRGIPPFHKISEDVRAVITELQPKVEKARASSVSGGGWSRNLGAALSWVFMKIS